MFLTIAQTYNISGTVYYFNNNSSGCRNSHIPDTQCIFFHVLSDVVKDILPDETIATAINRTNKESRCEVSPKIPGSAWTEEVNKRN